MFFFEIQANKYHDLPLQACCSTGFTPRTSPPCWPAWRPGGTHQRYCPWYCAALGTVLSSVLLLCACNPLLCCCWAPSEGPPSSTAVLAPTIPVPAPSASLPACSCTHHCYASILNMYSCACAQFHLPSLADSRLTRG